MRAHVYQSVAAAGVSRAEAVCVVARVARRLQERSGEVSVHFVGEKRIRTLNRRHRGLDRPTDVLSFPASSFGKIEEWGDIFLCTPYIQRQAKRFGVPYKKECLRMLIHGLLHLRGFDHQKKREAKKMFRLQETLLQECL